jgi:transposase InsO family protein
MITKEAKQRLKILSFWRQYGLAAATDAYGVKRSTLYSWQKIYRLGEYKIESLNPGTQTKINKNKRLVDNRLVNEIKRLRLEVCPNMGKGKINKYLAIFCRKNNLAVISESKIGRIINDKKIYHHRQKVAHNGRIVDSRRVKKQRKPKQFVANEPGDLIELDTIVKFVWGVRRYIITAVDIHSRYTFAWCYERANSANTRDFMTKLEQTFPFKIKAIQTDNGSEFHKYFDQYLNEQKTIHYWNYPGQPYRNGHIEKYNRTIQEEFIDWQEILLEDTKRFNQKLMDWLLWYNTGRFHWSLKLETPVDYLIKNSFVSNMIWTNTSICL